MLKDVWEEVHEQSKSGSDSDQSADSNGDSEFADEDGAKFSYRVGYHCLQSP